MIPLVLGSLLLAISVFVFWMDEMLLDRVKSVYENPHDAPEQLADECGVCHCELADCYCLEDEADSAAGGP